MFSWQVETVDTTGDVGDYASLKLDSYNYPYIVYYDWDNFILKYAKWNGSIWNIQNVDNVGSSGFFCSLCIDSNNLPYISYQENGSIDGNLKYAKWNGSSWDISVVDSVDDTGHDSSLDLDNLNYPHISYCDITNNSLKYARWNGSAWDISTVDSSINGFQHTSIAVDSRNYPHISYRDQANQDLKYAYWNGTNWNISVVDSQGEVGLHSSIKLDSNDFSHISYGCGYNIGSLKYAYWNGTNWNVEIVDSQSNTGRYSSLALDNNEYPIISYNDMDTGNLKLAYWDGTKWNIEMIDSIGIIYHMSISLDNSFNPQIAYYVGWNYYDLKYAKGTDIVSPAAISNFSVISGRLAGTVNLTWTAPGDNENSGNILNGQYRIEYSKDSNTSWGNSSNYALQWSTNTSPGNDEIITINNMEAGAAYYFWIKTADEEPNWSEVSVCTSGIARLDTDFLLVKIYPRIFSPNGDGINDVVNFIFENTRENI